MALLLLLLVFLLGLAGLGTSSGSSSRTPVPATHVLFTVDGKQVGARGEATLQPGQVLGFPASIASFTLKRLECSPVVVHEIKLAKSHRWRVPDLAEGAYSISGHGPPLRGSRYRRPAFTFDYVVRVANHSAPCPG